MQLQPDDIVVTGTDGLFDNVFAEVRQPLLRHRDFLAVYVGCTVCGCSLRGFPGCPPAKVAFRPLSLTSVPKLRSLVPMQESAALVRHARSRGDPAAAAARTLVEYTFTKAADQKHMSPFAYSAQVCGCAGFARLTLLPCFQSMQTAPCCMLQPLCEDARCLAALSFCKRPKSQVDWCESIVHGVAGAWPPLCGW